MWSRPQKIMTAALRTELRNVAGAYELGYCRGGQFEPKYIGRARQCLYSRLTSYTSTNRCHNSFLKLKLMQVRNHVYFRLAKVNDPASFEARRLYTHEIGRHGGMYEWNKRYEYAALRAEGWEFHE